MTNATGGSDGLGSPDSSPPSTSRAESPPDLGNSLKRPFAMFAHNSVDGQQQNQVVQARISAAKSFPPLPPPIEDESSYLSMTMNGFGYSEESSRSTTFYETPKKVAKRDARLSSSNSTTPNYKESTPKAKALLESGKHGVVDGRWVCGECGRSLANAWGLDQHIETVHGARTFKCDQCSLCFKRRDHLINHVKKIHKCEKTCDRCGESFIGRENYKKHMRSVHKIKITYFSKSGKRLGRPPKEGSKKADSKLTEEALLTSRIDAKDKGLYSEKMSDFPSPPLEQSNRASGCMPPPSSAPPMPGGGVGVGGELTPISHGKFPCEFCPRRFVSDDKLMVHKQTHHIREMSVQFCVFCKRHFVGITALNAHIANHHRTYPDAAHSRKGGVAFRCSYCPGTFSDEEVLEHHVMYFHLEEECLACGSQFLGVRQMWEHMEEWHRPKFVMSEWEGLHYHQCSICYRRFFTRYQAMWHFRHAHIFRWGLVSLAEQVHHCPHCNFAFDSWAFLHEHVLREHGHYGLGYKEPDYIAVVDRYSKDELVFLQCTVCNDLFHDQDTLNTHVQEDHQPFAVRASLYRRPMKFENEEHADYIPEELFFKHFDDQDDEDHAYKPPVARRRKSATAEDGVVKRKGRPKGSKNKPKPLSEKKEQLVKKGGKLKNKVVAKATNSNKKATSKPKPASRKSLTPERSRRASSSSARGRTPSIESRRTSTDGGRGGRDMRRSTRNCTLASQNQTAAPSAGRSQRQDNPTDTKERRARNQRSTATTSQNNQQQGKLRRFRIIDGPIFDSDDDEVMPTPKRRGQPRNESSRKAKSSRAEETDDTSDDDKSSTKRRPPVPRSRKKPLKSRPAGKRSNETESESDEVNNVVSRSKPHSYDPDSDDQLLRLSPKMMLRKVPKYVIERMTKSKFTGLTTPRLTRRPQAQEESSSSDEDDSEDDEDETEEEDVERVTNFVPVQEDSVSTDSSSTNATNVQRQNGVVDHGLTNGFCDGDKALTEDSNGLPAVAEIVDVSKFIRKSVDAAEAEPAKVPVAAEPAQSNDNNSNSGSAEEMVLGL